MKKLLPFVFFIVLAIIALTIKQCNNNSGLVTNSPSRTENTTVKAGSGNTGRIKFDRNPAKFYFTKHARCRMKCRQITQKEVKHILANGTINYNKSDLNDSQGPTYAVEGVTKDRQHVRIIFAPKQQHMSVVTVIDLEVEHQCDC